MNGELSSEALEYGHHALRAIEAAGGVSFVQQAELDSTARVVAEPLLASLGAWELNPAVSFDELEASATLCRSAGYWALPYPVAERLSRPRDLEADAQVVVAGRPAAAIEGLELRWVAISLDGERNWATPRPPVEAARRRAFVVALDLEPIDSAAAGNAAIGLVLSCWTLLGMLDRAVELTRTYVRDRHQFGQPLSSFQAVQFQLTDAEVERLGCEELAKYALWSAGASASTALNDALAARLAALEAAGTVFRVAHQLHGAIGFCDETNLSWISRYSHPLRRLPTDLSATRSELTRRIGRRPLDGLFTEGEAS